MGHLAAEADEARDDALQRAVLVLLHRLGQALAQLVEQPQRHLEVRPRHASHLGRGLEQPRDEVLCEARVQPRDALEERAWLGLGLGLRSGLGLGLALTPLKSVPSSRR